MSENKKYQRWEFNILSAWSLHFFIIIYSFILYIYTLFFYFYFFLFQIHFLHLFMSPWLHLGPLFFGSVSAHALDSVELHLFFIQSCWVAFLWGFCLMGLFLWPWDHGLMSASHSFPLFPCTVYLPVPPVLRLAEL